MLNLPSHSFIIICLILLLLIIASLSRVIIQNKKSKKINLELRQRIQSWWWMIGIVFAALALGQTATIILFAFISFLALKEFLSIIPLRLIDRKVIFWAYLAIPLQYYWIASDWYDMFIIFIPIYLFLFIPIRMILIGEVRGFIHSAGVIQWALILTVFNLSHIAFLVVLPVKNNLAGAVGPILCLLILTQFNDICQYIWGKLFGKHAIIPKVSPNKTWEGFLGGLVSITLCASILVPYLTPLDTKQGIVIGVIISIAGFFGDLAMSCIKRDLQIKDSGTLIPGHGGILDRLDSLIYTAPLFFHIFYYLEY